MCYKRSMTRVFLGIGSNLGEGPRQLAQVLGLLRREGVEPVQHSALYRTAPVGWTGQPWFTNAVVAAETGHSPEELLEACQRVEATLGRRRTFRFGPRQVDVDILFYGDRRCSLSELEIPHPRLQERGFVLVPLAEIAPELEDPVSHLRVRDLLAQYYTSEEWRPVTLMGRCWTSHE
jgi:2-amino-4-hydroxy-6-hydroxymethyldihydropteridine diphosphokinase